MKNDYEIRGDKVILFLQEREGIRFETIVSMSDLQKLLSLDVRWYVMNQPYNKTYVVAYDPNNRSAKIRLHRFLTDCPRGYEVDHINRNGLDNRKENLRICTHGENMQNVSSRACNSTGYRGVTFHKSSGKWHASAQLKGKHISFGYYDSPEEANVAAIKGRNNLFTHSSCDSYITYA